MSPFPLRRKPQPAPEGTTPMTGFGHRTPEQIAEALEKAHDARRIRSRLLARVRTGDLTLAELLSEEFADDRDVQHLPVRSLLRALPGVGVATSAKVMEELGIHEKRRIAGLGQRQRSMLAAWRP